MSEIELVLDGMRKTGECVSELEDALGVQSTFEFPTAHRYQRQQTHPSVNKPSLLRIIAKQFWPPPREPRFNPMVIETLREKEQFLEETRKQLRLLELSVDELTDALHSRRPSLRYDPKL